MFFPLVYFMQNREDGFQDDLGWYSQTENAHFLVVIGHLGPKQTPECFPGYLKGFLNALKQLLNQSALELFILFLSTCSF